MRFVKTVLGFIKEPEVICPICGAVLEEHLIKEGSRYHVLHCDAKGSHCSNSNCEINHTYVCEKFYPKFAHKQEE
jgi:translation initiation factor 2 beta subunit (eIF-2beta)/eIF-5